ncbi:hypothetical protein Tb11.02.5690 [Trypanosoma brucei brucei TREU927]|uniref:T. brucei spp.-specific protein n=1 Tax=Trypanosoma brucei brucei (strain 927/4 GUTat10.1) TaxID=185431 RepID=Q384N7_TRYB2|nr:hypothetical protein Tb11.02.5690 [Trypanosoma brucei brucei TREU927]EAN79744.1 hypothetical protein Tb11.02.5690 [Trypanosoma brucei brucei TREU927]
MDLLEFRLSSLFSFFFSFFLKFTLMFFFVPHSFSVFFFSSYFFFSFLTFLRRFFLGERHMCLCMYRRRGGELLTTCYYLFLLLKLALANNSFHSFVSFSTFVECLMRFLLFLLYRFTALYATPLFSFFSFFFFFCVAYSHRLRVQKLNYTLHARIFELIHHKLLLEVLIQPGNAGGIHPPPSSSPLFFFRFYGRFLKKNLRLGYCLKCFVLFCLRKYVIHHTYNMHDKTECYYYCYCY